MVVIYQHFNFCFLQHWLIEILLDYEQFLYCAISILCFGS